MPPEPPAPPGSTDPRGDASSSSAAASAGVAAGAPGGPPSPGGPDDPAVAAEAAPILAALPGEPPAGLDPLDDTLVARWTRLRRIVLGAPRDLYDRRIFHRLSLIPFLAWVGLGADGLSSSAYGPEEAFRALRGHTYLAFGLAALTAVTVLIISAAYSRIIEEFPHGGGGYVVATKLLGARAGVTSGCALLVDYVLTITVSVAAAGDAMFSFVPVQYQGWKLAFEIFLIAELTMLNLRGVRESILTLTPVFIGFLLTHAVLIGGGIIAHLPQLGSTLTTAHEGFQGGMTTLGIGGMLLLFVHAYSLGGGTYTGIEAVSNSLPIMRDPKVHTARRTMFYMATSLAVTAAGLLVCYLLWNVSHQEGKTLNAVLTEAIAGELGLGRWFVILTLLCEGALLVVAAQAGFIDGPRVLVNMAVDSWMPHRFAALSERLTMQNGILLMSGASLVALVYTRGVVSHLVVMYSINVFLTFSLSMFGMARVWFTSRKQKAHWRRRFSLFAIGFLLCGTILLITVMEKFTEGGWITLVVTGSLVALCFLIRAHYRMVQRMLDKLQEEIGQVPRLLRPLRQSLDAGKPTAVVLVGNYGGLGIHTVLNIFRTFPGHFKGLVFVSVGVVDSGAFKGEEEIEALGKDTLAMLAQYVELAANLGVPATARMSVGTDVVAECEKLCLEVAQEFPRATFFSGKIIFQRERWYQRLLHNETAHSIQKRLQWAGRTMVVLPARVR